MKTFKKYLNEKWIDRISGFQNEQSDVFINPTKQEVMSLMTGYSFDSARGFVFVNNGNVAVFSGDLLHMNAEDTEFIPFHADDLDNIVPVIINKDGSIDLSWKKESPKIRQAEKILQSLKDIVNKNNTFVHIK